MYLRYVSLSRQTKAQLNDDAMALSDGNNVATNTADEAKRTADEGAVTEAKGMAIWKAPDASSTHTVSMTSISTTSADSSNDAPKTMAVSQSAGEGFFSLGLLLLCVCPYLSNTILYIQAFFIWCGA
jgi:hypothetical protein